MAGKELIRICNLQAIALQSIYKKRFNRMDKVRSHPLIKDPGDKAFADAANEIHAIIKRIIQKEADAALQDYKFLSLSVKETQETVTLYDASELQDTKDDTELQEALKAWMGKCQKLGFDAAKLQEKKTPYKFPGTKFMKDADEFLENYSIKLSRYITEQARWELTTTIQDALLKGQGATGIRAAINKLGDDYAGRSMKIARTEGMRALNQGRLTAYDKMGVEQVTWIASELACEECSPLDREIFDIDDVPELPLHIGCRCTIAAVTRFTQIGDDGKVEEID